MCGQYIANMYLAGSVFFLLHMLKIVLQTSQKFLNLMVKLSFTLAQFFYLSLRGCSSSYVFTFNLHVVHVSAVAGYVNASPNTLIKCTIMLACTDRPPRSCC